MPFNSAGRFTQVFFISVNSWVIGPLAPIFLRAFYLGSDLINRDSPRDAIPQFQRAIELDPNFAHAYEILGVAYLLSGDPVRQREVLHEGIHLGRACKRARTPLHLRGLLPGCYARAEQGTRWMRVRIRGTPHNGLFVVYDERGEWERALEEEQEALRLGPRVVHFIVNMMNAYLNLDRFDEAKAMAQRAFSQKMDGPSFHSSLLDHRLDSGRSLDTGQGNRLVCGQTKRIPEPRASSCECHGARAAAQGERTLPAGGRDRTAARSQERVARESEWYAPFALALTTGMRPNEYLALKWSDIDWHCGTVSVCRTIQISSGAWTFYDTKRKRSRRAVKL
jgi:tetratricopeptide (TPR) repeat protein